MLADHESSLGQAMSHARESCRLSTSHHWVRPRVTTPPLVPAYACLQVSSLPDTQLVGLLDGMTGRLNDGNSKVGIRRSMS